MVQEGEQLDIYDKVIEDYSKYFKNIRKRNGEKFLPKSIKLYSLTIRNHINKIVELDKDVDGLIEYFNSVIKNNRNLYTKSAFKHYLFFIGVDEEDERIKHIKSPKRNASALTSERVLGEKSINENDMNVLINSIEDDYWKLVIMFLYDSGIRCNEFLNLRWKDVIKIEDEEVNVGAELIVLGKGNKFRTTFIFKNTAKKLFELKTENSKDTDKIFVLKNLMVNYILGKKNIYMI